MSKHSCIPMTKYHQELILAGKKTTTLRAKRFEPGVYRMFSRGAGSLGYLRVADIADDQIIPASYPKRDLLSLANFEGYDTIEAFMAVFSRLRLSPDKAYWLHLIEPCEVASDE